MGSDGADAYTSGTRQSLPTIFPERDMLMVLSPAKTLDYESELPADLTVTRPDFLADSAELIDVLRDYTPARIASLMSLSDKLAALNVARYQGWHADYAVPDARPAIHAFKGDVYTGLEVERLRASDLVEAQRHLRILSGLYGLLRPLDLMLPYRLEMGTELVNPRGRNLYAFWGDRITEALNMALAEQGDDILVNLASNEYFKAVNAKKLQAQVFTPQFKDAKNGQYKMISFFAKKARGRMAAWLLQNRIRHPDDIRAFDVDGYVFNADLSTPQSPVFTRAEGAT